MPSFITDEENTVVSVMSFDPTSPEQLPLATYDASLVGKVYVNGAFYDVETRQVDSPISVDNGGNSDE